MEKNTATKTNQLIHDFTNGKVCFFSSLDQNTVSSSNLIIYFFASETNKATKANEKILWWTSNMHSIVLSKLNQRHCLSVNCRDNNIVIHLIRPSCWFDHVSQKQTKIMELTLCALKNSEIMNACLSHKLERLDLSCYFGCVHYAKLRETMLSGVTPTSKQIDDNLWNAQLFETIPHTHLRFLQQMASCRKLQCSPLLKSIKELKAIPNTLKELDLKSLDEALELILSSHYKDPTVSLVRVEKSVFFEEMNKMIISYFAYVEKTLNKNAEDVIIEDLPSTRIKHIHEMIKNLTKKERNKIQNQVDATAMPPPPPKHTKSKDPNKRAHGSDKSSVKSKKGNDDDEIDDRKKPATTAKEVLRVGDEVRVEDRPWKCGIVAIDPSKGENGNAELK